MLHDLPCQLVLASCLVTRFLLTSASRGESEDDTNPWEPHDVDPRVMTERRPAASMEAGGDDVLLAARDSLLQASRKGSLIQQHIGYESLLATRDALLNAMKDKQTVSSHGRGSVPQGDTSASLNLPYSSFVSPAPSETIASPAGKMSPSPAITPTALNTAPNTVPVLPPTVPTIPEPSATTLQQDPPAISAIPQQANVVTDAAGVSSPSDSRETPSTQDAAQQNPPSAAPQVTGEQQTTNETPPLQNAVVVATPADPPQANREQQTANETPPLQTGLVAATIVKVTNQAPAAPQQGNQVAGLVDQLESTKAKISELSQALSDGNAQSTGDQAANKATANAGQWVGKDFSGYFKSVKYTVIRIQAITAEVNWFQPYKQPQDAAMVGSGFAVYTDGDCHQDPVFLTNAHVVRDAHDIQVQLPALGQVFFDAYVPLICEDFDLAIVQLANPAEFLAALKGNIDQIDNTKVNGMIQSLRIEDWPLILGLEVASVGFPLGSTSLKLSRGVISGTEEVGDFICYQTTAPISPGSSGGPLFALNDANKLQVVGATFASSASREAQNTNYVVPTVSIIQVINEFRRLKDANKLPCVGNAGPGVVLATQDNNTTPSETVNAAAAPTEGVGSSNQSLATPSDTGTASVDLTQGNDIVVQPDPSNSQSDQSQPADNQAITREGAGGMAVGSLVGRTLKPTSNKIYDKMKEVKMHGRAHNQFRIAPVDSVGIESNKALYEMERCNSGVFLSKILDTSVFKHAAPGPIPERSFLTKVADTVLDSFGMGRTTSFLGDPTPFESLMMEKAKDKNMVPVTICQNNKTQEYQVNMTWNPEWYDVGVKDILEPHFETEAMEYEVFAGVTIMQMTVQHIIKLLKGGEPPTIGRWLLPENQKQQRLIVTYVEQGTYASRVLAPGMVVDKVNRKEVANLKDLRAAFIPDGKEYWELVTDRNVVFATSFLEALENQIAMAESGFNYLWTQMIVSAAMSYLQHLKSKGHMLQPAGRAEDGGAVVNGTVVVVAKTGFPAEYSGKSLHDSYGGNTKQSSSRDMIFPDAEGRMSKLAKARALMMTAGADGAHNASDFARKPYDVEARRRARVARAGFLALSSVDYKGLSSF